jgi:uncharacterized protein (TIRG00374 family)
MKALASREGGLFSGRPLGRALRWLARRSWAFQIVATGLFLALLVWRVDVPSVVEPLGRAHYGWAGLALLVAMAVRVIDTARWRVYLRKLGRPPLLGLLGAFLIGNLGNNLLPARAGDIARIQIVANRYGLPRAGLASATFIVEAMMDGVTFLVLLVIGLAVLEIDFVPVPLLAFLAVAAGGGLVAVTLASHLLPRQLGDWRPLRWLPGPVRRSVAEAWPRFLDGLETMRNPRLFAQAVGLNFLGWLTHVLMFWCFGLSLGLDLDFGNYVVIMVAANLVVAFPITFQSIGTYQLAMTELLAAWGVEREAAFAFSVASHAFVNVWTIVTGVLALWLMQVRPRDVFSLRGPVEERAQTPAEERWRPTG